MDHSSKTKIFVLDCCNKNLSRMPEYDSSKDLYLAGYFAMRNRIDRKFCKKNQGSPEKYKHMGKNKDLKPNNLKQSRSLDGLGSLTNKKNLEALSLSSTEFRALIDKYRGPMDRK